MLHAMGMKYWLPEAEAELRTGRQELLCSCLGRDQLLAFRGRDCQPYPFAAGP
jgi:hypothetical protein